MGELSDRAIELFAELCDLSFEEQAERLTELGRESTELRDEVHELLAGHRAADPRLDLPAVAHISFVPLAPARFPETERLLAELSERPVSRYRFEGELGRGGMGRVLSVWDKDLRRNLAMKVILGQPNARSSGEGPLTDPRLLGRFIEEAQVTGQLDHPGIVPVHELGLDEVGRIYFTMRLVKGRDLKVIFELVHSGREHWNETRALGVLLKACEALAYAHATGVIHRDLKPANVMVGRYGEVYVMDWGLARATGREDHKDLRIRPTLVVASDDRSQRPEAGVQLADSPLMTMDGDVVGTPAYMSPEQARGDLAAMGPASDVYSLGAMLYHLLAGQMPYVPANSRLGSYAIWALVQKGPPDPLSALAPGAPAELVAICEKAMARDVSKRYADTEGLAEDLRAFLEHRVVGAYETGAIAELRKWVARNKSLAAALAVAVLLLVAGLASSLVLQARSKRNADEALRERANVLRLSAFQRAEDLQRQAHELWPPWPKHLAAYDMWLAEAQELVAGLDSSADGKDRGHRTQLAAIEARALPRTEEDLQADRRSHPRFGELAPLTAKLAAFKRGQAVRKGQAQVAGVSLNEVALPADAQGLNNLAWARVAPDRTIFGEEARGLALARLAFKLAQGGPAQPAIGATLARAFLANGLDDDALATMEAALRAAGEDLREEFENNLDEVRSAVLAAHSGATQAALEAEVSELSADVLRQRSWNFATEEERWWHGQLKMLVASIATFADADAGAVEGEWGIQRRRDWAASLAQRTVSGEEVAGKWAAAQERIAVNPSYAGLVIAPQLGLVPLGLDPGSGLEEFGHPLTGSVPKRGPDGRLELVERMGLVFVLIPRGTFWMGAQSADPQAPNYDPAGNRDEGPLHTVELSAFFLSKYEMTQGQWQQFTGTNPSRHSPETHQRPWNREGLPGDLLHPVEQVTWLDCVATLARMGLTLPSEAQWEYGARANTSTPWWTGNAKESLIGAANLADRYAREFGGSGWVGVEDWLDDGNTVHARVGSYSANGFGLFDVHGNMWEWCLDGYVRDFYASSPTLDPVLAPSKSSHRVNRGGSFYNAAVFSRVANRAGDSPTQADTYHGLRPARALESALNPTR